MPRLPRQKSDSGIYHKLLVPKLFVPGGLLKESDTIELLELHDVNPELTVQLADAPSIDTIPEKVGLVEYVVG